MSENDHIPHAEAEAKATEQPQRHGLRKGIYILPNLFTLGALFGGFYAIVRAMDGRFEEAAVGIFVAMILDGLDGRIARLTKTQSEFGVQMDSLSDMVSFGIAPAVVTYAWSLHALGRWGWIASFVYAASAALRLARFNVNTHVVDKRFFQGLPSPAAAGVIAGLIWMLADLQIPSRSQEWMFFALTLFTGLTMVTNIPYYSFKTINLRRSVPFFVLILIALALAAFSGDPPKFLFALFTTYALSGYIVFGYRLARGQRTSVVALSKDEPEERGLHADDELHTSFIDDDIK